MSLVFEGGSRWTVFFPGGGEVVFSCFLFLFMMARGGTVYMFFAFELYIAQVSNPDIRVKTMYHHIQMRVVAALELRVLSALRGHFVDARWALSLASSTTTAVPILSRYCPGRACPVARSSARAAGLSADLCQTAKMSAHWPVSEHETLFFRRREHRMSKTYMLLWLYLLFIEYLQNVHRKVPLLY